MDKKLREKIENEVSRINRLFDNGKPLMISCGLKEPDVTERFAITYFLQSFYTGIESIIELIFKYFGEEVPSDRHWHKKLLGRAFERTEKRTSLFKDNHKAPLEEYLTFRHFSRHSYGVEIDWERLKPLVTDVGKVWKSIEQDIREFVGSN